jgi:hypothetical protein
MNIRRSGEDKMASIQILRSVVTHFSEELRFKAEPKEEVTVGGRIIDVIVIDQNYVALTLDDYIGTIRVIISTNMYQHFKPIIEIGSFVKVGGYVNKVSRKEAGEVISEYSVIGFDMNALCL